MSEPIETLQVSVPAPGTIALAGEFDFAGTTAVHAAYAEAVSGGPRDLVLDLAGLRFMDSSALGVLIELRSRQLAAGHGLTVTNPEHGVVRILEITGLTFLL